MDLDLHGHHPDDLVGGGILDCVVEQAWEMGETELRLIHGHGRNRGISPGFVNTNTGYLGLRIRGALRNHEHLRRWIKYSTLNCKEPGFTSVKMKRNPSPTRTDLDEDLLGTRGSAANGASFRHRLRRPLCTTSR
jgi:hypothetical protein